MGNGEDTGDEVPKEAMVDHEIAARFMLQEYGRIIDAYHNLHVQKNELVKFYLTFVSVPVTVVVIFLSVFKYLQPETVKTSLLVAALQIAAIFLSILLITVGVSVLMSLFRIRTEQYLYIKTINFARAYCRDRGRIDEKYLVLPCDNKISFGYRDVKGRPFWEAMIIGCTNSSLIAFLTGVLVYKLWGFGRCIWVASGRDGCGRSGRRVNH
jgi:hypothetical protein